MLRVANFTYPLSQFTEGFQDECASFGCADIYYSVPPTASPNHSATDIIKLADLWYAKEDGSDSSTAGLDVPQVENILQGLGLKYEVHVPGDINTLKGILQNEGIPCLLTAPESSFFDMGFSRVPYKWDFTKFNHSIVAYGIDNNGDILVRDYANLIAEPGSERSYSAAKIRPISIIGITPRWKTALQMPFVPTEEEVSEWTREDRNMPVGTGLMVSWCKARRQNHFLGSPLDREYSGTFQGQKAIMQDYEHGLGVDIAAVHVFYDARGLIGKF